MIRKVSTAWQLLRARDWHRLKNALDRYAMRTRYKATELWIYLHKNIIIKNTLKFSVGSPYITPEIKYSLFKGTYEDNELKLVDKYIERKLPVIEFGAGIGVISCSINRILEHPNRHIVVEPNSLILPILEKNRLLNGVQFVILNKAIAYGEQTVKFSIDRHLVSSTLYAKRKTSVQTISVSTTTLKTILDECHFDKCSLVCDIEGGEASLVENEIDLIRQHVKVLILEVHEHLLSSEIINQMFQKLQQNGFRAIDEENYQPVYIFENIHL